MANFQGILFDIVDEVIIERGPVLRGTEEEAMADALALLSQADDSYDRSYCFVFDADHNCIIYD